MNKNYINILKDIISEVESTGRDILIDKILNPLPTNVRTPNEKFIIEVREYISTIQNKEDIPDIFIDEDIFFNIPILDTVNKVYGDEFISKVRMIWSEWRFNDEFNPRDILRSDIVDDFETNRKDF